MILAAADGPLGYVIAILAVCATVSGVCIAVLAWRVNVEKLRLDLYLRRYALYKSVRKTVSDIADTADPKVIGELIIELEFARAEADYMFGQDIENDVESILQTAKQYHSDAVKLVDEQHPVWIDNLKDEMSALGTAMTFAAVRILGKLKPFLDFHDIGIRDNDPYSPLKKMAATVYRPYRRLVDDMERIRKV